MYKLSQHSIAAENKKKHSEDLIYDFQNHLEDIHNHGHSDKKSAFFSSRYSSKKPWYLLIGLDQAGKTSLIEQSDLSHIETLKSKAQNFTSWITPHEVYIRTPGYLLTKARYIPTWLKLIECLLKIRPKYPIDGIILTISCNQLIELDKKAYEEFSLQLHSVLFQIAQALTKPIPIYLIVTKLDEIRGFRSYFGLLSDEERSHPFGFVIDIKQDLASFNELLSSRFHKLVERLNDRLLWRMEQVQRPEQVEHIQNFPLQIEYLTQIIQELIQLCFTGQTYSICKLRGCFFTTIFQGVSRLDCLNPFNESSEHSSHYSSSQKPLKQKTYFVKNLLHTVIRTDKEFHSSYSQVLVKSQNRRRRILWTTLYTILGLFVISYFKIIKDDIHRINHMQTQLQHVSHALIKYDPAITDLAQWVPILSSLDISEEDSNELIIASKIPYFFKNLTEVRQQLKQIYQHTVNQIIIPQLEKSLHDKLQTLLASNTDSDKDKIYYYLKAYLMLNQNTLFNAEYLYLASKSMIDLSIDKKVGESYLRTLKHALTHSPQRSIDQALVAQARSHIAKTTPSVLAFYNFKSIYGIETMFPSNLDKIPTFYDKNNYKTLHQLFHTFSQSYHAHEDMVLGPHTTYTYATPKPAVLFQHLLNHYAQDISFWWENYLVQHLPEIETDSISNLILSLKKFAKHTSLEDALKIVTEQTSITSTATKEFKSFHQIVTKHSGNQRAQIVNILSSLKYTLDSLVEYFEDLASSSNPYQFAFMNVSEHFTHPTTKDGFESLSEISKKAPAILKPWTEKLLQQLWQMNLSMAEKHINQQWTEEIYPYYMTYINGRYPINKQAEQEIDISKFVEFFAPNGRLQQYIKQFIEPFYDIHKKNWQAKKAFGLPFKLEEEAQQQLIRSQIIQSMFFVKDALQVEFTLKQQNFPQSLTTIIDINGQQIKHSYFSNSDKYITWPGRTLDNYVQVICEEENGNKTSFIQDGPWAWFKLLDRAEVTAVDDTKKYLLSLSINNTKLQYELTANKSINPFLSGIIEHFTLPEKIIA